METYWFLITVTIGMFWGFAYLRASHRVWVSLITFLTLCWQFKLDSLLVWLPYLVFMSLFFYKPVRRRVFSRPLLILFKKILPKMSQTEQEALDAGSIWWDGELFSGAPNWNKLLNYPMPRLSNEETEFLKGPVEELCQMIDDWKITHDDFDLPPEIWQFLKDKGFFALIIPKKYGGLEFSAMAHSEVVVKVSSRSVTAAVTVMVPNSLGPGKLLHHYGTDEQKNYYLPRLAKGIEIPCFALTGPEAGSDAGAMPDTGVVCEGEFDGKTIKGIKLNWEKRYITLGPVATLLGLAFKLYDPDHLIGDKEDLGITVALIKTDLPGIDIGDRHNPLDVAFQNGPNKGKDVFIPLDWIIGGVDNVGKGWRMLMESLSDGRGISLPAVSTGAGKFVSRFTGAYSMVRTQFNTPIGNFEGIEEVLTRVAGKTYQMEAARLLTLSALDCGENPSVISAIIKYHLTENMRSIVNDAMDIHGGSGICLGPRNIIGRVYQAIPVCITVEGANILTRCMIIFGQGAIRCHPFVLKEINATANKDRQQALINFDDAFFGHIGFYISNKTRAFTLGLTRGWIATSPVHGPSERYFQYMSWMSAGYALTVDTCMSTLGGALKRKEKISARLGDILSELYILSAVVKNFEERGRPEDEEDILKWSCQDSLYKIQQSYIDLFQNLPFRPAAWFLRIAIFPTGFPFSKPSDNLGKKVADLIRKPSDIRDRLTSGIYLSKNIDDATGRLDIALEKSIESAPLHKKLSAAKKRGEIKSNSYEELINQTIDKGILTAEEANLLRQAYRLKSEVIAVSSFSADSFKS